MATAMLVALTVGVFVACNVFSSIDVCSSDADCPATSCDPVGHFCLRADAARDADVDVIEGGPDDAGDADVYVPRCSPNDPFTTMKRVPGFENRPTIAARLTSDESTVIFSALDGCTDFGCYDLWISRLTDGGIFGEPTVFPAINCDTATEFWPTISADTQVIFFESNRALVPEGGACGYDVTRIWSATRPTASQPEFDVPRVDAVFRSDGGIIDSAPYLHPGGRSLYFVSQGRTDGGGQDILVGAIDKQLGFISTISPVTAVNTEGEENFPMITRDDLTLYFARLQPDDGIPEHIAYHDIWVTTRPAPGAEFGEPRKVTELATNEDEIDAWISDDQCRLYFTTTRETSTDGGAPLENYRLWVAERSPR